MKTKFNFRFLVALLAGIFLSINVFAQDLPVTGTIVDDFGEPVLGANVVVNDFETGNTSMFKASTQSTNVMATFGIRF